jgi:hypothetical protein
MSATPPAAKGSTMRTERSGYVVSARAGCEAATPVRTAMNRMERRRGEATNGMENLFFVLSPRGSVIQAEFEFTCRA